MMVEDDQRGKNTFMSLDVHPTDCSLLVNYTIQPLVVKSDGRQSLGDVKAMQKVIKINGLDENTLLNAFAKEVVDKCSLIPASQVENVEQQLYYLQKRPKSNSANNKSHLISNNSSSSLEDQPSMDKIQNYIESLYEEIPDKINATRNIMLLARDPQNMEILMRNDSLVSALTRTLREDVKKSTDLVTNILNIFFSFSNFNQYHGFITSNKIGDMTLKIIEQELARYDLWMKEALSMEGGSDKALEYKKISNMIKKQEQLLFVCIHLLLNLAEDLSIEVKMVKRDIIHYLVVLLERKTCELSILVLTFLKKLCIFEENKALLLKDTDRILLKFDDFLFSEVEGIQILSLRILFNLCFDPQFRKICIRQEFIPKLFSCLEQIRSYSNQQTINNGTMNHLSSTNGTTPQPNDNTEKIEKIYTLLYLLSVESEVVDSHFAKSNVIEKVLKRILESGGTKDQAVMALSINIASMKKCGSLICQEGYVNPLMKKALKTMDPLLFKLLRHLLRKEGESKLLFLDFVDDIMDCLIDAQHSSPAIFAELLGICSSLSIKDFDYAKLIETYNLISFLENNLSKFVKSAAFTRGSKKNYRSGVGVETGGAHGVNNTRSSHSSNHSSASGHHSPSKATVTTNALLKNNNSNSNSSGHGHIPSEMNENDDIALELVIWIGTMTQDEGVYPLFSSSRLINMLIDLMLTKEEDDEIVLHTLFALYRFMANKKTQEPVLKNQDFQACLTDLLYDRNVEIRKVCDACLDIMAERNLSFKTKIKQQKFTWHNAEWLNMIQKGIPDDFGSQEQQMHSSSSDSLSNENNNSIRFDKFQSTLYGRTFSNVKLIQDSFDVLGNDLESSNFVISGMN